MTSFQSFDKLLPGPTSSTHATRRSAIQSMHSFQRTVFAICCASARLSSAATLTAAPFKLQTRTVRGV